MSEEVREADEGFEVAGDEVDEVLAVLGRLLQTVASPVVRACLEEAHQDIAHLTGRDSGPTEDQQPPA
jgi:hypothetical protein